ncbi:MAG TPA: peptidoglycan-binding domain-containing protein [Gemmatimonadales bacterium]|jgi:peptidoglycan hydrolase-like protein with peptidoglycan-binding domain
MTRRFALIAGLLLSSITAGSLLAQTAAPTKPTPNSGSMQHNTTSTPTKPMSQDSAKASSSRVTGVQHTVWTKDQIKEAQEGLAKAGYFKGKATGVFGRRTRSALRAYQKANKLPVTGRLSNDLLTRLRSA